MERLDWRAVKGLPGGVAHVLESLAFDGPQRDRDELSDDAVYWLHRNQLTLMLQHPRDDFYRANRARLARVRAVTEEVLNALPDAVLLKGFARASEYVPDAECRMHYDVDLYAPDAADRAAQLLRERGFEPVTDRESRDTGHLAPMVRPTSWKWRGDFFDLETPVHVEIHRRLWTPEFEGFALSGVEAFWDRRERCGAYLTLSRHDSLAHRAMHLLRHLLRGDFRAIGIYEIAYFVHQSRNDDLFWSTWTRLHSDELQRAQAVGFGLARRWFGCAMHSTASAAVDVLPRPVRDWILQHAASPAQSFFTPNKYELALHFALVDSATSRMRIAARRLIPMSTSPNLWESRPQYFARMRSRAAFHARSLAPSLLKLLIIRR